jgi:RimJ/RimL family protein N-acetyltransferase
MKDVYLRALEISDLDRTWKWHTDAELCETLVKPFRYISRAAEEQWIRQKAVYSQTEIRLAICLKPGDEHIGNIQLMDIDWTARHAEIGIIIGEPQYQSKGYGQQAMRLMLRHAFHDLGLHRLYLLVFDDNLRAIRVYEKCGFLIEGTLRQHAYKHGQFKDLVFMGICAAEPGPDQVEEASHIQGGGPAVKSPARTES